MVVSSVGGDSVMMELDILVSFADISSCRALSHMISEGHMLLILICMPIWLKAQVGAIL